MQLYYKFRKFNPNTQQDESVWYKKDLASIIQEICCDSDYGDGQLEAIQRSINHTAEKLGELINILHRKDYLLTSDVLDLIGSDKYHLAPSKE
jgi:hypothetical protein